MGRSWVLAAPNSCPLDEILRGLGRQERERGRCDQSVSSFAVFPRPCAFTSNLRTRRSGAPRFALLVAKLGQVSQSDLTGHRCSAQ